MRIAWFSPFPPVNTGIAAVSAEVVASLGARGHAVDAYPETAAHDFPWRHRRRPYDLIVYQFGNSSHHDYTWPYALRYPGMTVLHDTRLHHARAALLLRERRRDDYRRELAWSEPGVNPDAAELAIAGLDSALYYDWPMVRSLVATSRLVAVHGEATRRELIEALSTPNSSTPNSSTPNSSTPNSHIVSIRLGHGELVTPAREATAREGIRSIYGIPEDAIVFGVFGGLTPEKRIRQILAAFRETLPYAPSAHLLLGGAVAAHADVTPADVADLGTRVTMCGYIHDEHLTDHIAAVDVSLNLRWPTARETSGPWLRALAAGRPTVITDLLHLAGVVSLDPRTWTVRRAVGPGTDDAGHGTWDTGPGTPIAIAIDILDEDHSLRLAMRRLATDADLRATLGRAAQAYWQREHSIAAMADDYESIVARCASGEIAAVGGHGEEVPHHLRPVGDETLRALLVPFGADTTSRASVASEPRERSAPAERRARGRAGESEGRRPSDQK